MKLPDRIQAAIEAAGVLPEPEPIRYHCQTCLDLGVISYDVPPDDSRFGKLHPCPEPDCIKGNERRAALWRARYQTARLPDHYRGLTFETFESLKDAEKVGKWLAYAAAVLFATRPDSYFSRSDMYAYLGLKDPTPALDRVKNAVMLYGGVGMGKTGLMAAAANHMIANGIGVLYIRAVDLIEEVQSRYGKEDYPTAKDVLNDFKTARVLFIDEFGLSNETPDRLEKIESVIESRRANYLPTFLTSNLDQQGLIRAWGERTADRVKSMAHWIELTGLKLRPIDEPMRGV